jgi:hypothetical protein
VAEGIDLDRYDDWTEKHIIDKIPGAGDAAE